MNLTKNISDRISEQLAGLEMKCLAPRVADALQAEAEAAAEAAAFAYVDALTQTRVLKFLKASYVPRSAQVTSKQNGVSPSGKIGVQGASPLQKGGSASA